MPLDFGSTIAPANNLRLPDALAVTHGPARLLSRFVIEGDKAARRVGIQLRLRHDFDELVYLNQQHTSKGSWVNIPGAFNPNHADLNPDNAFWIAGEDEDGEIAVTWAARVYDWSETTLADQIRAAWYGRDLGQPCVVTAAAAAMITGGAICGGASWVRPDFRGKHLSHLVPRIGKAYGCSRWPLDWSFCFISKTNIDKGLADSYGQKNLSYSVVYPGSPWGEVVIAYTPIAEVHTEFAEFLANQIEGPGRFSWALPPVSDDLGAHNNLHGRLQSGWV
jgi:hypothetical protein